MRENRVKRIMKSGGIAIGAAVSMNDPTIVEIIGLAGFDAVFIDMEHSPFDLNLVERMLIAADLRGITSIVRPPDSNPSFIGRLLDMGAQGIQVPHVDTLEDAIAAVKAVRYAPLGERGVSRYTRAAQHGTIPLAEHLTSSNNEVMLSVMIEDEDTLNNIESIASVEGIDLLAVGVADLSRSLGVLGQANHPKVRSAVDKIAADIKKVGKARLQFALQHGTLSLDLPELMKLGVSYTTCYPPPQVRLFRSYQDQVKQLRALMPQ